METEPLTGGEPIGLPIYLDDAIRGLPDSASLSETDWYPATGPTGKLWRCFECLGKISFYVSTVRKNSGAEKKRRFAPLFAGAIWDLFGCVRDLANAILSDEQTRGRLSDEQLSYVRRSQESFDKGIANEGQALKVARDKLSAHTDRQLGPKTACQISEGVEIHIAAAWLHASLLQLTRLAEFDCYAWTCNNDQAELVRLMTCEPFLVSFLPDNPDAGLDIKMTNGPSPRQYIHDRVAELVDQTQWMFKNSQRRLRRIRD